MKDRLVLIRGPYNLLQVLWLYSTMPDGNWYAIVQQYDNVKRDYKTKELCEKSGIFKKVIFEKSSFEEKMNIGSILEIIVMILLKILKKQDVYFKKKRVSQFGVEKFDTVIVQSDFSILAYSFISSQIHEKVILEDGMADYVKRDYNFSGKKIGLKEKMVSKLGYGNPSIYYPLEQTKTCLKYCSMPEKMQYSNFLELKQLFQLERCDVNLYKQLIERTFSMADISPVSKPEVIVFTSPLAEDYGAREEIYEQLHQWLKNVYTSNLILIKKHPRDSFRYKWDDLNIIVDSSTIPSEVLISYWEKRKLLLMFTSTLLLTIIPNQCNYDVIKFNNISSQEYHYNFEDNCKKFDIRNVVTIK